MMSGAINMRNAIARWFLWNTMIIYFQLIPFPLSPFTDSTTLSTQNNDCFKGKEI